MFSCVVRVGRGKVPGSCGNGSGFRAPAGQSSTDGLFVAIYWRAEHEPDGLLASKSTTDHVHKKNLFRVLERRAERPWA
jgi:hypothetical protein